MPAEQKKKRVGGAEKGIETANHRKDKEGDRRKPHTHKHRLAGRERHDDIHKTGQDPKDVKVSIDIAHVLPFPAIHR